MRADYIEMRISIGLRRRCREPAESVNAAAQHARAEEKVPMDLTTATGNLKAQVLYESLGWKRDEVFYTHDLSVE